MPSASDRLRVALVAGTLGRGGAEKQLVYIARALLEAHAVVRVYSLTRGEFYEGALRGLELEPVFVGRHANPALRLLALRGALRPYRPHIVQSAHFFANLYVTMAAPFCGGASIGSIRGDGHFELESNPGWGPWLLRLPPALIANSEAACRTAEGLGARRDRIRLLPNVIDLEEFDRGVGREGRRFDKSSTGEGVTALVVSRLVEVKRLDRFLTALALARRSTEELVGVLVGDGPERVRLESQARDLGLLPDGVRFLGRRDDVPMQMARADMLVLTSDHEGFPNVLLEAMAARLPVVTTLAGGVGSVVRDGVTGYVVPPDGVEALAERMARLARSTDLRRELGEAGRRVVEQEYSRDRLPGRLLAIYRDVAERRNDRELLRVLAASARSGVAGERPPPPLSVPIITSRASGPVARAAASSEGVRPGVVRR